MQERRPVPALTITRDRRARRRATAVIFAVAAVVVLLDQIAKSWAASALADRDIHVIWTLRFSLSYNSGVAFGLGKGVAPVLVGVAVVVVVGVVLFGRAEATLPRAIALGLIVGGAAGNLADRIFRSHGGAVIDFIDLQWWPVFNVADAAITCGGILL